MEIFRNLARRKLRSTLTVLGIVIGILALTTMGAMAEYFNTLLDGGVTYFSSAIQVADDSGSQFNSYISTAKVQEIERIEGVAKAFPEVSVTAKPGAVNVVSLGLPDTISSHDPAANQFSRFKTSFASGHDISADSRGDVVLGSTMADEFKKNVGDTIDLPVRPKDAKPDFKNHTFNVVGILKKTGTAPDTIASVSLTDAQMLLQESLPVALRSRVDASQLATGITVYGKPGTDLDGLADRITADVSGVKATRPSVLVNSFKAGGALFTTITTAAAVLALIIGGIAVINTMIMAVTERVREIGLKKAVGARTSNIMREFLTESTMIGLLGGLFGFGLGFLLTTLLNLSLGSTNALFLITPRLVVLSLGFAILLGTGAGIIPAFSAARMDPVRALRTP